MRVVAIDQGTTSTKALLVEDDGSHRLLGARRHRRILPAPGRVEHDPAELLRDVTDLLALGAEAGAGAAALANQGEHCRRLGPRHRPPALQRHRLAGPAHRLPPSTPCAPPAPGPRSPNAPACRSTPTSPPRSSAGILDEVPDARPLLAGGAASASAPATPSSSSASPAATSPT